MVLTSNFQVDCNTFHIKILHGNMLHQIAGALPGLTHHCFSHISLLHVGSITVPLHLIGLFNKLKAI